MLAMRLKKNNLNKVEDLKIITGEKNFFTKNLKTFWSTFEKSLGFLFYLNNCGG